MAERHRPWWRDRLGWLMVAAGLYGLICLGSLALEVGRPFPGFLTYHNFTAGRLEIVWNTPGWWWLPNDNFPRISDELVALEGLQVDAISSPQNEGAIYDRAAAAMRTAVGVDVRRQGRLETLLVPLQRFSWSYYLDLMLAPTIVFFCLWSLAAILYRVAGDVPVQRLAVAVFSIGGMVIIGIYPTLYSFDQWRDLFLGFSNPLHVAATGTLGAALVHFSSVYPHVWRKTAVRLFVVRLAYVLAALMFCLYLIHRGLLIFEGITPLTRWLDRVWFLLSLYLLTAGMIALTISLGAAAFSRRRRVRRRRQSRLLLLAALLTLPALWLAVHGAFGASGEDILFLSSLADTRYFVLPIPLAYAAITLRYYPIPEANRWLLIVIALALSGFLANLALLLIFRRNLNVLANNFVVPPLLILFLIFFGLSLFWMSQSQWRGWLGTIFAWEQVSFETMRGIGNQLLRTPRSNVAEMADVLAKTICQELEVLQSAIWLVESDRYEADLVAQAGSWPLPLPTTLNVPAFRQLTAPIRLTPTLRSEWQLVWPGWEEVAVLLPLVADGHCHGCWAIGQRREQAVFDDRDLVVLELLSQQATILLQNVSQSDRLRQVDKRLLQVQDLTRQKMAQDLHDHLLPELARLSLDLLIGQEIAAEKPQDVPALLADAMDRLTESSRLIRRLQQDLVSRPLAYGLAPFMQQLVDEFRQSNDTAVVLSMPADVDERVTELPQREAVYSICRQALTNVRQHAQATEVIVSVAIKGRQVVLTVDDNGVGMSPVRHESGWEQGHFGLESMRLRVVGLNGKFTLRSSPGAGTCVEASLPLSEETAV